MSTVGAVAQGVAWVGGWGGVKADRVREQRVGRLAHFSGAARDSHQADAAQSRRDIVRRESAVWSVLAAQLHSGSAQQSHASDYPLAPAPPRPSLPHPSRPHLLIVLECGADVGVEHDQLHLHIIRPVTQRMQRSTAVSA